MPQQAARLETSFPKQPSLWTGTVLSVLVGLSLYAATARSIESDARQRFANHARHAQLTIASRVKSYTDVLRGAASLFQADDKLTGDQFHDYVKGLALPENFPAIATMNFAFYVEDRDRAKFEADMRAGIGGVTAPTADFHITPPGRRDAYSVLTFIEPRELWAGKLGLDIQFHPHVAAALTSSRDSGIMVTSGLPIQAMSGASRTGLGMRLPVYRQRMPITNVAERKAAYLGSVGIAFSVHQLVQGVLGEMPIRGVRLILVDHGTAGPGEPGRTIFDSSASDARVLAPVSSVDKNHFATALPIDFNGRTWVANLSVSHGALSTGINEYFPWLSLLAGFVSSMLLYALFHTLASSRRRAVIIANEMTKELRESEAELQASHHEPSAHCRRLTPPSRAYGRSSTTCARPCSILD
jgi:CHASE1-domain containing sensor protein